MALTESDRRVRRTRRAIIDAFLSLVEEKGYEKTTVLGILTRADIGRSTFYAHYRDKEAVLLASFDEMEKELRARIDARAPAGNSIDIALPATLVFEHAYRYRPVVRALCGKQAGDTVMRYLHRLIAEPLAQHFGAQHATSGSDPPTEVVAEFYATAAIGLLTWWIDHDFCRGPTWLATTYAQIANHRGPITSG
jgi:AcrR family transcriptional regulator